MRSLLSLSLATCEWLAVTFAAGGAVCGWQITSPWPALAAVTALAIAALVRGLALRRASWSYVERIFGEHIRLGRPANRNEGGHP